jgi:hypothetical protein
MPVGAQDVRQNGGVAGIRLSAGLAVPLSVARHRSWIDGEHHESDRAQRRNQQPLIALNRHLDRGGLILGVRGQQLHELAESGDVIADARTGHHRRIVVHNRDAMMALGPINPARPGQIGFSSKIDGSDQAQDPRGTLMGALGGATPHYPTADPATGRGHRLHKDLTRPVMSQ